MDSLPETDEYGAVTARCQDATYDALGVVGPDVAFYRSLARELGGPVLELGCGTGRLLLEIATDGHHCTGPDQSEWMLDVCRAKDESSKLDLVRAPMQRFDLGERRFRLIFSAFRAFQHLYTVEAQIAYFACVRRHLEPGGVLAFDVFNPRLGNMIESDTEETETCASNSTVSKSYASAGSTATRPN